MYWHELRDALAKDSRLAHERRPEYGYARISIDLGDADYVGTDIPLAFSGDQIAKIQYTGSVTGTYFRLNSRHAQQIFASEFKRSNIPFTKMYLTNPSAQVGKVLTFYIGTGIFASIQPSTFGGSGGEATGITRSDGTVINPAEGHAEDVAHVTGDVGVMPLAVRQDTLAVLAAAGDYIPLVVNASGELWVFDEQNKIDGGGDLQKVKEELEKITTAIQKIDDYEDPKIPDHQRVVDMLMDTDFLVTTSTGGTDTIAAPASGHHLEVFGYVISFDNSAATGTSGELTLKFATSAIYLFAFPFRSEAVTESRFIPVTGIRVVGASEEALTLTAPTFTGGNFNILATVFYKDVLD